MNYLEEQIVTVMRMAGNPLQTCSKCPGTPSTGVVGF